MAVTVPRRYQRAGADQRTPARRAATAPGVTTTERAPGRTTVSVEQSRLSGAEERERRKEAWRDALTALEAHLAGG